MNAPTLIVGLGGKGSDVALRVSKMVTDEQRQRIGFAVFDTDVNELRQIKNRNPFVHTIQTSTKLSVGEYLDIDTHARDTWFPVNAILNSKTLTEGAGQVRAVSRMAFETAVRAGKMEELHKAIEDLYKLEEEEYQQALRVIIVSSLAGGTGSGLILPVALYIKNYLATRFRQSANITRGFFLLPEVFYSVIPGQAERNNLKSNAYATLREIDAFMMKGDSTLPERYKDSVRMEFPSVSSGEFEEYGVRPYDFCFLFDAQNADGKKLNSFNQYLDHAANCIYAQSIGPMNKRSNSSEDNTIRKLVSERGRNRYAGAGTSMLIYPMADVKRYMALNWAKECVSDVWLMFDRAYKDLLRQNTEMRKKGIHPADIKESKNYIASVEANASNKDAFATEIRDSCAVFDDNEAIIGYKWDEYMNALETKIKNDNRSLVSDLDNQGQQARDAIANIQPGSSEDAMSLYADAYWSIVGYKNKAVKRCSETSRTIAYSIFRTDSENILGRKEKYQLETYMRSQKGDFIHPCAVRYFLYKVEENMSAQLIAFHNRVKAEEQFFDKFEANYIDDESTPEVETIDSLNLKVTFLDKIRRRFSADQEDLIQAFNDYMGKIDSYRVDAVYLAVLEEGLSYVKSLSDSFASFFKSFDSKIDSIDKETHQIENKYSHLKGTAARYVCASKQCLKAMSMKMPYSGGAIEIDNDLAEAIYSRVRNYAVLSIKSDTEDYFSAIFDKDIVNYFEKKLMETYGNDINVDIITAIEKELEYEQNIVDTTKVEEYIKKVIHNAKNLAAPFIEKPIGEEKDPINSCAFNDKLSPFDDSPRAQLISEQLLDFGGEPDADIPKNMILFYKSFYGLRANDLSKFAPPKTSETHERSGGEYFKAYYELVSKIHPVPSKSKVITPHIDRWWHNITKMPDLDENNQEKLLDDISAAFFWAFVMHKIDLYDNGPNQKAYKMLEKLVDDDDDLTLTVSNGTPCDQLYEVLDALSIYPEFVQAIIRSKDEIAEKDVEAGKTAFNNVLVGRMEDYKVSVLNDPNSTVKRSIFELPFLLKQSTTAESYNERDCLRLMTVAIEEAKKVIKLFSSEADYTENVKILFMRHFSLLIENLKSMNTLERDVFKEHLFARVYGTLASSLEEMGLDDSSKTIRTRCEKLAKGESE